MRHPWLLQYSVKRLKLCVELVLDITGRPSIGEIDVKNLINVAYNGNLPKKQNFILTFVYRELAESLDTQPDLLQDFLRADSFSNDQFKKFFKLNLFSAIGQVKANVAHLREIGFSTDSLLKALFAVLIPGPVVDEIIKETVVNANFPMNLNLEQEMRFLNLLQYWHDKKGGL